LVNLVQKLHFVTARPRPKLALLVALGLLLPAVILALAFYLAALDRGGLEGCAQLLGHA
jgi:hypothetical protein